MAEHIKLAASPELHMCLVSSSSTLHAGQHVTLCYQACSPCAHRYNVISVKVSAKVMAKHIALLHAPVDAISWVMLADSEGCMGEVG